MVRRLQLVRDTWQGGSECLWSWIAVRIVFRGTFRLQAYVKLWESVLIGLALGESQVCLAGFHMITVRRRTLAIVPGLK